MAFKTVTIKFPDNNDYIELDVKFKEDDNETYGIEIDKIIYDKDDLSDLFNDEAIEIILKLTADKAGIDY